MGSAVHPPQCLSLQVVCPRFSPLLSTWSAILGGVSPWAMFLFPFLICRSAVMQMWEVLSQLSPSPLPNQRAWPVHRCFKQLFVCVLSKTLLNQVVPWGPSAASVRAIQKGGGGKGWTFPFFKLAFLKVPGKVEQGSHFNMPREGASCRASCLLPPTPALLKGFLYGL